MTAYRLNKRGTLFGLEEGRVLRADFASQETINPAVTDGGLPVPVVFGTRIIDPTVVGWAQTAEQQSLFYDLENPQTAPLDFRPIPRPVPMGQTPEEPVVYTKMILATMRMVLCVGKVDTISRFSANNLIFHAHEDSLPPLSSISDFSGGRRFITASREERARYQLLDKWTTDGKAKLYLVSEGDSDLFGIEEGGVGYLGKRDIFGLLSQASLFWFSVGEDKQKVVTLPAIDLDTGALGVSSLLFYNFNFGGRAPLSKWQIGVTRINHQTQRVVTDLVSTTRRDYKPQWQSSLSHLTRLKVSGADAYYMIIVDRTLGPDYLTQLKKVVEALPYDETDPNRPTTRYRLIEMSWQDSNAVYRASTTWYSYSTVIRGEDSSVMPYKPYTYQAVRVPYFSSGRTRYRTDHLLRPNPRYSETLATEASETTYRYWTYSTRSGRSFGQTGYQGVNAKSYWSSYHYKWEKWGTFTSDAPTFSIDIGSRELTTDRDLVLGKFDDLIRSARRNNYNYLTTSKLLSYRDGEFIVHTYTNDLNEMTRGGRDVRINSVVLMGMTNLFGSVGGEIQEHDLRYPRKERSGPRRGMFEVVSGNEISRVYFPDPDFNVNSPGNKTGYLPDKGRLTYDISWAYIRWSTSIGIPPNSRSSIYEKHLGLFSDIWMSRLKFPRDFEAPTHDENADPETDDIANDSRYKYPLFLPHQFNALKSNPPEVRVILWKFEWSRGQIIVPSPRVPGTVRADLELIEEDKIKQWDSHGEPIEVSLNVSNPTPTSTIVDQISSFTPLGWTMNPIHALRECLIDPDWGEGIPETKIDEDTFVRAAQTCYDEKLDYCYVHKELGGVDKLITAIMDYVEGVVYYEPHTDKVIVRLIREDFDINHIVSFNETNISSITNYRRQHTDELTNSVTVRFHEAAKGSSSTMTVHDVDAAVRGGGVVSATLNYDGCATQAAAEKVAVRELNAMSRQLLSFTANVRPPDDYVIGLGEPLLFSYRDLGLERIVMRVSSIDFGDGTRGGVTLNLIQDVYADLALFDPQAEIDVAEAPDLSPVLFDLPEQVEFLEAGWTRINQPDSGVSMIPHVVRFLTTATRYLQAGIRYRPDPDDVINNPMIEGRQVPQCIGELLTDIPYDGNDPRPEEAHDRSLIRPANFSIRVRIGNLPKPMTDYIRIGNEIFRIGNAGQIRRNSRVIFDGPFVVKIISTDIADLQIDGRAFNDTVPSQHSIGDDVWFTEFSWLERTPYQAGASFALTFEEQDIQHRRVVTAPAGLPLVGRLPRPLPPYHVRVSGCGIPPRIITGGYSISAYIVPKKEIPWSLRSYKILLSLTYNGNEILSNEETLTADTRPAIQGGGGYEPILSIFYSDDIKAALGGLEAAELHLSVSAVGDVAAGDSSLVSIDTQVQTPNWQSWEFDLAWSSQFVEQGWGCDWGDDWDSDRLSGWDIDWDQDWGE